MTTIFGLQAGGLRNAMVMGGIDGVLPQLFAAVGRGQSVAKQWTSKAHLRVDRDFKKQTEQADFLDNNNSALLVSARVQAFLCARVKKLEVLPVNLLGVTGSKKLSTEYAIVNVLHQENCVDVEASKGVFNRLAPTLLISVSNLVLDDRGLSKTATLFRLKHVGHKVFVTSAFKAALEAESFTNMRFGTPKLH